MALVPTVPVPPVNEALLSGGQMTQRLSRALNAMVGSEAGGDGSLGFAGVTDGSDAAAGNVGQYLEAAPSGPVALTTDVLTDIVALGLPAGDWDVNAWVGLELDAGSATAVARWGVDSIDVTQAVGSYASLIGLAGWTGSRRHNVTGTTTVTLRANVSFTAGTATVAAALLRARRVR
jgi:hypothetical protein